MVRSNTKIKPMASLTIQNKVITLHAITLRLQLSSPERAVY
jgi:hypothetical protein